jgi:hypothetical protein
MDTEHIDSTAYTRSSFDYFGVHPCFSVPGHSNTQLKGGCASHSADWSIVVYLYALLQNALNVLDR